VTGARLAPGGATEAAADRDLNRLYTLLRLLLALEVRPALACHSHRALIKLVRLQVVHVCRGAGAGLT